MSCFVLLFFFVQAEDGIRDYKVTGVQTCALPISSRTPTGAMRRIGLRTPAARSAAASSGRTTAKPQTSGAGSRIGPTTRSEERRVGKEGRSRWVADHHLKKRDGDEE